MKGLGGKTSHMCDIYTKGREEAKLGRIVLNKGTGYYNACFQGEDMDGTGLCVFGVTGLRIIIDESRYCETEWKWGELPPEYAKMHNGGTEIGEQPEAPVKTEERRPERQTEEKEEWKPETQAEGLKREEKAGVQPEGAEREKKPEVQAEISEQERKAERSEREYRPEYKNEIREPEKSVKEETEAVTAEERVYTETEDNVLNPAEQTESEKSIWNLNIQPVQVKPEKKTKEKEEEKTERKYTAKSEEKPVWRLDVRPAKPDEEEKTRESVFQKPVPEKKKENDAVLHKTQMEERKISGWHQEGREEMALQKMLYDDKWKQLRCLYPVCHPFGEEEEYISIAPKDFVILRKEYQNLVSNSFLLHSFYNYHHVILGKAGERNEEVFYIGVPGAYLEREKKVAVMFGFEGFALSERGNRSRHTAGRGTNQIETGAFGYYMRKVEI